LQGFQERQTPPRSGEHRRPDFPAGSSSWATPRPGAFSLRSLTESYEVFGEVLLEAREITLRLAMVLAVGVMIGAERQFRLSFDECAPVSRRTYWVALGAAV
jgi:hypothetical protein